MITCLAEQDLQDMTARHQNLCMQSQMSGRARSANKSQRGPRHDACAGCSVQPSVHSPQRWCAPSAAGTQGVGNPVRLRPRLPPPGRTVVPASPPPSAAASPHTVSPTDAAQETSVSVLRHCQVQGETTCSQGPPWILCVQGRRVLSELTVSTRTVQLFPGRKRP